MGTMTKTKQILLADDELTFRKALSGILEDEGYEVTVVSNGKEALEDIITHSENGEPYDLLLTDIRMPMMTGFEVMDELKEHGIQVPTIVITGYGNKEAKHTAVSKGCNDYLDKPFEPETILTKITQMLNTHTPASSQKHYPVKKQSPDIKWKPYYEQFANLCEKKAVKNEQNPRINICPSCSRTLDIDYHCVNSISGSDFIHIHPTKYGHDILTVNIAGSDANAEYYSNIIKAFFEENCRTSNSGLTLFHLLNNELLRKGHNERLVTAQYIRLNLTSMYAEIIAAAHPPAMVLTKQSCIPHHVGSEGSVLGQSSLVYFDVHRISLTKNDRLFICNNGFMPQEPLESDTAILSELIAKHGHEPEMRECIQNIWNDMQNDTHEYETTLVLGIAIKNIT